MKKPQAISRRRPARTLLLQGSGLALLAALAAVAGHARADDAKPAAPIVEQNARAMQQMEEEEQQDIAALPPLRVGDATATLFALQRSGEFASATPRPIAGPVAHRSYERYLRSFEHAIPEYLNSSVKKTPGEAGR